MRLTREEAVARIAAEVGDAPCLICALLEGRLGAPLVLAQAPEAVALLPRYGLGAGHAIVALRDHVTRFAEVSDEAWAAASHLALRTARAVETALAPSRCYVASLGSAREDLPMTSPHLHLHVVPVADVDARPAGVLTWQHGVSWLDDEEGLALLDRLRAALAP